MALLKNKFTYKNIPIKYKVSLICDNVFGIYTYSLFVYFKYGGFFGDYDHFEIEKNVTSKHSDVQMFIIKIKNTEKQELAKIIEESIKKEMDKKIADEEIMRMIKKF